MNKKSVVVTSPSWGGLLSLSMILFYEN